MTEIMILQSLFSIAIVLLEVPTGYFADVFGRKVSLIYANIFWVIGFGLYSVSSTFVYFLIAEILIAFGSSFNSGAIDAMIYDTLRDLKRDVEFKKIWGAAFSYGMVATAFASIAGGYLGNFDFRWPWYATTLALGLMLPITLTFREPKRHKFVMKKGYTAEIAKIIKYIFRTKRLRWLIIYSSVIAGFNRIAFWLYQPYFKLSGLDLAYFGIVFASFQIVAAISGRYAHKLESKLGEDYSLVMLVFLLAGGFFLMSNFVFLFSFSFAFLMQFLRGFQQVVIKDYINKLTKSKIRATVLSAGALVDRLAYAAVLPLIGFVSDAYSITNALTVMGVVSLAVGVPVLYALHKSRVI